MTREGIFRFAEILDNTDREAAYYYDDGFFMKPSSVLDPKLRTMSMNMCMAFFPSTLRKTDYSRSVENANALLSELGFSHIEFNPDYMKEPEAYTLGIGAAHKYLDTEQGKVSLIVLNFRGAGYGDEWASNIILGKDGPAEGFNKGKEDALLFLREYIKKHEDILLDRIKYWIAGFSRVAAIANLLGSEIDNGHDEFRTDTNDIFVYTFESPLVADYRDNTPHDCIHNTINPFDMVPMIPPKEWGFIRYGKDDTILPAGHSEAYKNNIEKMKERLRRLNPLIPYEADSFTPVFQYGGEIVPISSQKDLKGRARPEEWWYDCTQDEYLDHLIHFMSLHIVQGSDLKEVPLLERRRQFSDYSETAFSEGARVYLGTNFERREGMRSTLHNVVAQDMEFKQKAWIYFLLFCNNSLSMKMVKRYMWKMLLKRVKAQPGGEDECAWLKEFGSLAEPLADYFVRAASRDVRRYRFAYLSSLVVNLDRITSTHCPEVILAWLQTIE